MKTSSLLLSSAAILAVGSAFAADLPAKKAAPTATAAATGCPAFGPGYFAIPGETCIKIGGYVRSDNKYTANVARGTAPYSLGYKYILGFDTKSNSELGTVNGRIGMYDSGSGVTTESAYVDLGGFRAGYAPSYVDFSNGYNNSGLQYQPTGNGVIGYTMPVGTTSISVAAESASQTSSNKTTTYSASRPDLILAATSKIGDVTLKGGLVSHEVVATTGSAQGFAALGRADLAFGDATVKLGAAYANGAVSYLDNPSSYVNNKAMNAMADSNSDGTGLSIASMATGALEYNINKNKDQVYAYAGSESGSNSTASYAKNTYGIGFKYNIAKGMYVRPETYQTVETKGATRTTTNYFYLRIRRDF